MKGTNHHVFAVVEGRKNSSPEKFKEIGGVFCRGINRLRSDC